MRERREGEAAKNTVCRESGKIETRLSVSSTTFFPLSHNERSGNPIKGTCRRRRVITAAISISLSVPFQVSEMQRPAIGMYWAVQKDLVKGCHETLECYCVSCDLLSASIADTLLFV